MELDPIGSSFIVFFGYQYWLRDVIIWPKILHINFITDWSFMYCRCRLRCRDFIIVKNVVTNVSEKRQTESADSSSFHCFTFPKNMNGLLVFNSEDGSLLLYKQYLNRFGFDENVKESHDVFYLSTMLFTLYCNANFIQVSSWIFVHNISKLI